MCSGSTDFKAADIYSIIEELKETDDSEAASGQDVTPSVFDCCNSQECGCTDEEYSGMKLIIFSIVIISVEKQVCTTLNNFSGLY